jgi:nucleolar protein 58
MDTGQGSSLPGLWLFLLVILAALGLIIASTSVSMHLSQYRARRDLRRRIAAGEIDLESLGIKRLTVPKEMIDAMPIKIYGASSLAPAVADKMSTIPPPPALDIVESASASPPDGSRSETAGLSADDVIQNPPTVGFEQAPCCAICLDDYVVNTTPVRHLPCNHIFHPHCIDPFLQTRSSLCPLCKRSVLPKGFIPPTLQLTNATVARERRIRLMRERARNNRVTSTDQSALESGNAIEMVSPDGTVASGNTLAAPTQEEEDEELRRRPFARRMLESVFPVFTRPAGALRRTRRASQSRN